MKIEKIYLKDVYNVLGEDNRNPSLIAYLADNSSQIEKNRKHPGVIICPGGAYIALSDRESEAVALYFLNLGFQAFVLNYSVSPHTYPAQLLEISAAVAYVRTRAEEFYVDTDKIFTCGFSAGGHLAGCSGVFWKKDIIYEKLPIEYGQGRPNGIILCYSVVSGDIYCERINSFDYLIGDKENKKLYEELSLQNGVDNTTPPMFIWHTNTDQTVPVMSAIILAQALIKAGVDYELHIFGNGPHGLSLCNHVTASSQTPQYYNDYVAHWKELLENWLRSEFNIIL